MNPRRLLVFDHTALLALLRGHTGAKVLWDDAVAERLIMVAPALSVLTARAADTALTEQHWEAPLHPAVVMPLDQVAALRLPLEHPAFGAAHAALEAEMVHGMVVTTDAELYHDKLVPLYVLEPDS